MCMNCGCGEVNERHQDTDITRDDLERAAQGGGMSLDEVTSNLRDSLDQMGTTQGQQSTMPSR